MMIYAAVSSDFLYRRAFLINGDNHEEIYFEALDARESDLGCFSFSIITEKHKEGSDFMAV